MANLPVVLVIGVPDIELMSRGPVPEFETTEIDCRCYPDDKNIYQVIARECPVAIVTIGPTHSQFEELEAASYAIRRIWRHYPLGTSPEVIGNDVFNLFLDTAMTPSEIPLVSVITPLHNTGDKIFRPYHSLIAQTYKDWEWIIVDDSEDNGETFEFASQLAADDSRIRVFKESKHSGVIGHVKRNGFDLARGMALVELDHDDQLTPECLEHLMMGYSKHPDVGFIYTDFSECFEDGGRFEYPDGWGFGYGSYRTETHNGMEYSVANTPNINAKTIRHIVAAPNHVRSWRADVYRGIGGHNPKMHVVDDYELLVRTFLETRMGHIPKMSYIQYRNQDGNTHQVRNQEIQRLVRYISVGYDRDIHNRFEELGVDDFVWDETGQTPGFYRLEIPSPGVESHATIEIEV